MKANREKGHALPLALIVLGMGTVLVIPLLQRVSIASIAARNYSASLAEEAAASAGVEDAIWGLTSGTLAAEMPNPGDSESHSLDQAVNEITPQLSITRDYFRKASEGFESGDWSGGSGWGTEWNVQGQAGIQGGGGWGGPVFEGEYSLRLQGEADYAKRAFDLSNTYGARLRFWARARSFDSGEEVQCLVSSNGTDWTVVETWVNGDDDDVYRFYDIDLSAFQASGQFWVAFQANLPGSNSYFYLDNITILRKLPGIVMDTPSDDFESRDWAGGTHWLAPWVHTGNVNIKQALTPKEPWEGKYNLEIRGPNGYVERPADLSGWKSARLQLWGKINQFEQDDRADIRVSADGIDWYSLFSWTPADNNPDYQFVDMEIPEAVLSSGFRVAFQALMNNPSDKLEIDALIIVGTPRAYRIMSDVGRKVTTVDISIEGGNVTVYNWLTETKSE